MPTAEVASPPSWLDTHLIQKAIRAAGHTAEIKSVEYRPAAGKGDGYASTLYRAKIHLVNGDNLSVLIKFPLPVGALGAMEVDEPFFMESKVYHEVIPAMQRILSEAGRNDEIIGPRMLHWQENPVPVLILEDLSVPGFKLADRREGLDWDHMLMVILKMARWHAASIVLHNANPKLLDHYRPLIHPDNMEIMTNFYLEGWNHFIRDVESWNDDLSRRLVPKLKKIVDNFVNRLLNLWKPNATKITVFTHNDLWINNIMFRYGSDGKVQEARFIDFSLATLASPAMDLHYFLVLSSKMEVRHDRNRRLIEAYHEELQSCLRDMKVAEKLIPSLQDIQEEMRLTCFEEMNRFSASAPLVLLPQNVPCMDFKTAILNTHDEPGPHPRSLAVAQPNFRAAARFLLEKWDQEGMLDLDS